MTHPANDAPAPSTLTCAQRKASLVAAIEQQRIDILVEAERWHHTTASLDSGLKLAKRYRGVAYLAGAVLLVGGIRHPGAVLRIVRRLVSGGLMLQRARRYMK